MPDWEAAPAVDVRVPAALTAVEMLRWAAATPEVLVPEAGRTADERAVPTIERDEAALLPGTAEP